MWLIHALLKELSTLWGALKDDLIRITLLAVLGLALLQPDAPTWSLVSFSFGLSFLLVAASHIARKILFKRIDLARVALTAVNEKNIAAGIVFLAVCLVLIALLFIMAAPLLTQ